MRWLASKKERFGIPAFSAKFEGAEVFVPVALRYLGACLNPKAKAIQVFEADVAVAHPLDEMIPYRSREFGPDREFRHLLAENEAAQFIAQALGFFRVGG